MVSLLSALQLGLASNILSANDVSYAIVLDGGLPAGFFSLTTPQQHTLLNIFGFLRGSAATKPHDTVFRNVFEPVEDNVNKLAEGVFEHTDLVAKMMYFYNQQNSLRITSSADTSLGFDGRPQLHCLLTEGGDTKWECLRTVVELARVARSPDMDDQWLVRIIDWTISGLRSHKNHVGDVDEWIDDRIALIKRAFKQWKPSLSQQIESF